MITCLALLVGVVAGLLAIFVTHEPLLQVVVAMLTVSLGLQLGELVHRSDRTPKLAKLEEAVADRELYAFVSGIVDQCAKVRALVPPRSPLGTFVLQALGQLCDLKPWSDLAEGRLSVQAERELTFTTDALQLASREIRAVSFGDEEFWHRVEGQSYVEAQREVVSRGVRVTRIFVLSEEALLDQRAVIEHQAAAGISVKILRPRDVRDADREDFVLYDDHSVRFAMPVAGSGTLKRAVLSVDPDEVDRYDQKFRAILLRSVNADQYFASLSV